MTMLPRVTTISVLSCLLCISTQAQQVTAANSSSLLNVDCNFGVGYYSSNYSFQTISNSVINGTSRRCKISHRVTPAIVRISLDSDDKTIRSLYAVVFDKIDVRFVTKADAEDFQGSKVYHFHACPLLHTSATTELSIVFFSTPDNGTFSIHIDLDEKDIDPGETKAMTVRQDGLAEVMAFDVKDKDLFKLLELTASSESEDVVYYLFISKNCAMVQLEHLQFTNNNQSSQVIKLTFSRFGRLTLSQFSHPKISPGRWYIGIQIKDPKRGSGEMRSVNISMSYTYYYATIGKGLPVLYMILLAFLGGIAIAVFAHFFLNSDFEEVKPLVSTDDQPRSKANGKRDIRIPGKSVRKVLPDPLPRKTCPIKTWGRVISIYWWGKGLKTFSYTTGVLAIAFGVGSSQFVIARWNNMIEAGDRDLCYYNERCYRPIAFADIPSNFMLSNIPYIIHGLILATSFSFREAICAEYWSPRSTHRVSFSEGAKKIPYDFSVAYSFSWALVFEGLFSAIYHLCPSRLTFQFDSAFMFIISGLVVVALYNSHVLKTRAADELTGDVPDGLLYSMKATDETPIQAPKYFLFFVSPLLLLNYAGSVHNTAGLPLTFEVVYWIVLVIWLLGLYVWAFQKLGLEFSRDCWSDPSLLVKWFCFLLFPICLLVIGLTQYHDWSQFFLFSCVAATSLSIVGLIVFDLVLAHRRFKVAGHSVGAFFSTLFHPKTLCCSVLSSLHRIVFVLIMFLFWVFAMYFFKLKPTAKKAAPPHISRTYNKECVLWDFFDYHDIWHMLSSFALFMSAYLLIYVTRKVEKLYWVETRYWRSKDTQTYSALHGSQQISQGAQTQPPGYGGGRIAPERMPVVGVNPEGIELDLKQAIQPYIAESVTRREKLRAGGRAETQWKRESLV